MVHTATSLHISLRENETSIVRTAINMYKILNNVYTRRSASNNACNVTIKFAKKRSTGRKKNNKY